MHLKLYEKDIDYEILQWVEKLAHFQRGFSILVKMGDREMLKISLCDWCSVSSVKSVSAISMDILLDSWDWVLGFGGLGVFCRYEGKFLISYYTKVTTLLEVFCFHSHSCHYQPEVTSEFTFKIRQTKG